jgi:hypothetical protein
MKKKSAVFHSLSFPPPPVCVCRLIMRCVYMYVHTCLCVSRRFFFFYSFPLCVSTLLSLLPFYLFSPHHPSPPPPPSFVPSLPALQLSTSRKAKAEETHIITISFPPTSFLFCRVAKHVGCNACNTLSLTVFLFVCCLPHTELEKGKDG